MTRAPSAAHTWPAVVPRDHLAGSLLLLIAENPAHGYDLPALLQSLGVLVADRGVVYRALRLLEADAVLSSTWDDSRDGPRRRTYRITPAGLERVATLAGGFREVDAHMAAFLSRYRRLVRQGDVPVVARVPAAG